MKKIVFLNLFFFTIFLFSVQSYSQEYDYKVFSTCVSGCRNSVEESSTLTDLNSEQIDKTIKLCIHSCMENTKKEGLSDTSFDLNDKKENKESIFNSWKLRFFSGVGFNRLYNKSSNENKKVFFDRLNGTMFHISAGSELKKILYMGIDYATTQFDELNANYRIISDHIENNNQVRINLDYSNLSFLTHIGNKNVYFIAGVGYAEQKIKIRQHSDIKEEVEVYVVTNNGGYHYTRYDYFHNDSKDEFKRKAFSWQIGFGFITSLNKEFSLNYELIFSEVKYKFDDIEQSTNLSLDNKYDSISITMGLNF